MRKLILMITFFYFLFAGEYVITKYIDEKPIIKISYKGSAEVKKIIDIDFKVLDHFDIKDNAPFSFEFFYNKNTKTLTVKYLKNDNIFLIKKYRSKSFTYFPFLVQ